MPKKKKDKVYIDPFADMGYAKIDLHRAKRKGFRIVEVPVAALRDDGCVHQENEIFNGEVVSAISYHYWGRVIWGATARILQQFLNIYSLAEKWGD